MSRGMELRVSRICSLNFGAFQEIIEECKEVDVVGILKSLKHLGSKKGRSWSEAVTGPFQETSAVSSSVIDLCEFLRTSTSTEPVPSKLHRLERVLADISST